MSRLSCAVPGLQLLAVPHPVPPLWSFMVNYNLTLHILRIFNPTPPKATFCLQKLWGIFQSWPKLAYIRRSGKKAPIETMEYDNQQVKDNRSLQHQRDRTHACIINIELTRDVIHHGKHQLASIYSLKKKYIITLNCKQNDKNILLLISMSINTTKENNYKKSC